MAARKEVPSSRRLLWLVISLVAFCVGLVTGVSLPSLLCAWCGDGEDDGSNSHGICEDCADKMKLEHVQHQFDRVPSYVEGQAALFAEECDEILAENEVTA